ncbi:MAG: MGH1-like glycoside hydrolase domain-containing protein, partial [Muricoprocola sp.]
MTLIIDQMLSGKRRRLRTCPEKILMDATGFRLWADYMDVAPGFSGRIDFIHKINIPGLFFVECSGISEYEPADITWKPSHVSLNFQKDGIELEEQKFITEKDAAVSCMVWQNRSTEAFRVRLILGTQDGKFPTTYGEELSVRFFCNGKETGNREWTVIPGQKLELCIAAQVCLAGEVDRMAQNSRLIQEKYHSAEAALLEQQREYQSWYDQVPEFTSDQPLIDKTWAYRWYILRHNRMNPGIGKLKETFFCEGRSHKMSKEPYHPEGWEFTKLIPLSVPMHLLELRWYGEKEYGTSILHVMRDNQDESGEFRCAKVDWNGNPYANFFGWSVWQYYLVTGNREYAAEALPVVKKQIAAWQKNYGNEKDVLLTQYIHQLTGMEYQPSYWYFSEYPRNCRDESTFTPVKRVDRNVYFYMNAAAAEKLCEVCDDPEKEKYHLLADSIKRAILDFMWDEETGYFYDLHYQTNEKAFVKNIVGFFPFFGEITEDRHRKCLNTLMTDEFDTSCPFPSVSTRCPVFTG